MKQVKLTFTLKQKKNNIMNNMFKAKKIRDDYHTLARAGHVTLICLCTGHNRLNSHRKENIVPSPPCTCGTEDQTTEQGMHLSFKANSPVGYSDYQIQSPTIISNSPQNCPIFAFIITYIIMYHAI